ncbi:MAG: mannose-1-phosphate guanylyltransferase [Clostridium sp.]
MLCAVIMAGGRGTRFWPLSTDEKPKQFLNLVGDDTMLQATVERVINIIPIERIFICTGERYVDLVLEQLPKLSRRNIIVEPESRNTAPCIALAALYIKRYIKNATLVVLPSDHLIENEVLFRGIVTKYEKALDVLEAGIITFGMKPTRAETGYGYIKAGNINKEINSNNFYKVEKFVEKPSLEIAEEYIKDGSYLWNGGMFMWQANWIIERIKVHLPNTYEALKDVEICKEEDVNKIISSNYKNTDAISVDYGILEKESEIYVVPIEVGWDDVGSWDAVERYRIKDDMGNIHIGEINSVHGYNNLIVANNQKIIIDNLSDIYVVENNGQIIIGKKNRVDKIKELKNIG